MAMSIINFEIKRKYHLEEIADIGVLLSVSMYIIMLMLNTSTFYISFLNHFSLYIFIGIFSFTACRWLLQLPNYDKLDILGVSIAVVFGLGYLSTGYLFLLFIAAITVGYRRFNAIFLIRYFCVLLGTFLLLTFSSALSSGIENFTYLKDGCIRSSLGIIYPTDMATYVIFFVWLCWGAWSVFSDFAAWIAGVACIWFAKYIAMSETSTYLSILYVAVVSLCIICKWIKKKVRIPAWISRCAEWALTLAFPACAICMFLLLAAYAKGIGIALRINNLISNRLFYALNAYREYGIKPFGTFFDMIGNGGSTYAPTGYNFIDSTYLLILIRYGWVTLIAVCVSWMYTTRKAIRAGYWRIALVMLLICVHSMSEHHFIEANYNILLLLPLADFRERADIKCTDKERLGKGKEQKLHWIGYAAFAGILLFFYLLAPALLSWTRTIVQLQFLKNGAHKGLKMLAGSSVFWGLTSGILFGIWKLLHNLCEKKRISFIYGLLLLISGSFAIIAYTAGQRVIDQGAKRYGSLIHEDKSAIQDVIAAAKGAIYAEPFPELYRRRYPEISSSIFTGEDLARLYDTTVITDIDLDSECFIKSGFLFTPISDHHAVYTNDLSVVNALKDKGYHFTGYYSIEKYIGLANLAWMNNVPYDNGSLILEGENGSLERGPYIGLHNGNYMVSFDFHVDKNQYSENTELADITITSYGGEKELAKSRLSSSLFDDEGRYTLPMSFYSSNYKDIEFHVEVRPEQTLYLDRIACKRNQKYDIHSLYNAKRVHYRDEYYDLEGNPITTDEGYSACEYEYNRDRVVTEQRYYDADNQPVMIKAGYARFVRTLDDRNLVIREDYFDTEDKYAVMPQGYSIEERAYDEDKNATVRRYLDAEGNPVMTTWNYAEIRRKFNEDHRIIWEAYYGIDGESVNMPQGYAAQEREYDEDGNVILQRFLDADGNPVMTTWNYAEIHREFNEYRQVTREAYFGIDGNPVTMPQGYAVNEREYDPDGNASVQRYCDAEGRLVMTTWNYAEIHRDFNKKKQVIRESYFGADGKLIDLPQGYSINEREYDDAGNPIVQRYYDADHNPIMTTWNFAEVHRIFNDKRQNIEETYYGVNGEQIAMPSGQYMLKQEYDDAGNSIVLKYCNQDGNLFMTTSGHAEVHRVFNDKRQIIKETFYDTEGNLAVLPQGYSIRERTYKDDGSVESESYYDKEGNKVSIS